MERTGRGQAIRVLSVLALPIGAVCGTAALLLATALGPVVAWIAAIAATVLLVPRNREG